jgi:hypothetical protein
VLRLQSFAAGFRLPEGPLADLNNATSFLDTYMSPTLGKLECSELGQHEQSIFNSLPEHTYSPMGQATNY